MDVANGIAGSRPHRVGAAANDRLDHGMSPHHDIQRLDLIADVSVHDFEITANDLSGFLPRQVQQFGASDRGVVGGESLVPSQHRSTVVATV